MMKEKISKTTQKKRRALGRDSLSHAANITKLCDALGIDRQTYYNYRGHLDAPAKEDKGYNIDSWRVFLIEQGVAFNLDKQDLKKEITKRDIILRDIAIQEKRKKLISNEIHDKEMVQLAALFASHLDSMPLKIAAAFPEKPELTKEIEATVDEIRRDVVRDVMKLETKDDNGKS